MYIYIYDHHALLLCIPCSYLEKGALAELLLQLAEAEEDGMFDLHPQRGLVRKEGFEQLQHLVAPLGTFEIVPRLFTRALVMNSRKENERR